MLQEGVSYGPVRTDMDRCAEVTARTRTIGENALHAPEANLVPPAPQFIHPDDTLIYLQVQQLEQRVAELETILLRFQERASLPASPAGYRPFRQVCAAFFTPGKIESPGYIYFVSGQSDILVGESLPGYSPSGVREVDALALYHSCLGRIIPYLLEDLFLSFSAVCTGLVIGEGQDYDLERISLLLNSLDILLQASDASGNTLLSDTVVSYFVILDVCLMKGITDHCLRRICFENGMTGVMSVCYPVGDDRDSRSIPFPVRQVLLKELDSAIALEEVLCSHCADPHCPLRNYWGNHSASIRTPAFDCPDTKDLQVKKGIKPLSDTEKKAITPYLKALRENGFLDEHNLWIKGKHKKAYAGWVARVISYNVESVSQLQIGDLLGLSYILKAASDADGDILVCNTIEKIFSDARIQFSKPPRR